MPSNPEPVRRRMGSDITLRGPLDEEYVSADDYDRDIEARGKCIWTERDEDDGAMFSTSCGERVEPAPGLQTYCHCCGRKVEARG